MDIRVCKPNRPQELRKGRVAMKLVINIEREAFRLVLVVKLSQYVGGVG